MKDPLDRNKKPLTHKITALAAYYLDTLGCKPIETEVPMSDGKIVDIGSFTYPTMTELRRGKLLKTLVSDDYLPDYKKASLFNYRYGGILTVGVEVKITSSDFSRDLNKKYTEGLSRGLSLPTHLSYMAIPNCLKERAKKLNRCWGIIVCSDNGNKILKIERVPFVNAVHAYEIIDFIATVAIRRDHRTRYRALRAWLKSYRAK